MTAATDGFDELLARSRLLESPPGRTAEFLAALRALRIWQSARLARTYQDFRADPRYSQAVEFFLTDLYGPQEFTGRDQDLRRAWRRLRRALPSAAMNVLGQAVELEVLTLELVQAKVRALGAAQVTDALYAAAYRTVGNRAARTRQIDLIVGIGGDLDRIVNRAWLGALLHAAHLPAHAAGFGELQDFLERGYAAFRRMRGAEGLLCAIRERETLFIQAMFEPAERPGAGAGAGAGVRERSA